MKQLLSILFVAFLSINTFAQTTWNADPAHTQVTFEITHLGIADIKGSFNKFEGNIVASKEDFSDAQYQISINVPSIDTGIEMRDNHLRSADFFDAEKYPEMTFKSTSSEKVLYRGTIEHPQNKKMISGFAITGNVKRSDFNLGPKFPEPMLSDNVVIDVNGEFIKQ